MNNTMSTGIDWMTRMYVPAAPDRKRLRDSRMIARAPPPRLPIANATAVSSSVHPAERRMNRNSGQPNVVILWCSPCLNAGEPGCGGKDASPEPEQQRFQG